MDDELEALVPFRQFVERHEGLGLPVGPRRTDVEANLPFPEPDVLLLQIAAEVDVDRGADRPGLRDDAVGALLPVHEEDRVREKIEDREVMFDHDDIFLLREGLDHLRNLESLIDVQVR